MATILVEILGSAKEFKAALAEAEHASSKASGAFAKMGKASLVAGAAIAGGVAYGITKSVEAAEAMQVQTARMNAAFATSGVSSKAFAGRIEEAEAKARNLGFANEDVRGSLGSLVIATHSGTKAIKDLSVAQDIARFKHVSLESATKTLTMAMAGSQRAVKQLGIDVPKVTSHYDAMKATMGPTIDAHEKLRLAAAKLQDKMATSNLVIATVTDKLKGQAKAYSETAAGGMAVFHAQIGNLEEQVGTALLPTLTKITAWLVKELPVAVVEAKKAIVFLTPYFLQFKAAMEQVVDWVRAHWAQISTIIKDVAGVIASVLNLLGDLIHGRWGKIWDDVVKLVKAAGVLLLQIIKDIGPTILDALKAVGEAAIRGLGAGLAALPGAVKAAVRLAGTEALNAGQWVGKEIIRGIKAAPSFLIGLAGDLTGKITPALKQAARDAYTWALKIGAQIFHGVMDGIGDLYSAIAAKIPGGGHGAQDLQAKLKAKIGGGGGGSGGGGGGIGASLAQSVVDGFLLGTATLPQKMSQSLQNAINAGRATIQAAQSSFQTAWSQIASDADKAFQGIHGATQTAAGKKLADLQSAHDAAGLQSALTTAQGGLATATAGGDPAAILAAQQALADAQYAIQVAALQKQSAAQQIQLDARNALQQRHFDAALTNLQTHLAKGHATYAEAHKAILKLFKSFGISYSAAGADLGTAFVTGLKESIQAAAKKSGALSTKLSDVASGINVPHAATGGFVAQTGLAVIHQGETITPAGQGGLHVTVNVHAPIIKGDELGPIVRDALIPLLRRNPSLFGSLG